MGAPTLAAALRTISLAALTFAASPSAAGRTEFAGESQRTEVLFLGTAGGPPLRLDRSEPSTLLTVDGRPYRSGRRDLQGRQNPRQR